MTTLLSPAATSHPALIEKCLSSNGEAVIYAIDATAIIQTVMLQLQAYPPATKHLGQAMMSALLCQALEEFSLSEIISLQWNNQGPFGELYVEAHQSGSVRGIIMHPRPDVADFDTPLGKGVVQVQKRRQEAFTSMIKASGDVSLDMVEFFEQSDQRQCGLNLSVKIDLAPPDAAFPFVVTHALGYLIDILPQPSDEKRDTALLRWDRQMRDLGAISRWVIRPEVSTRDMLELISGEPSPSIVMTHHIQFACNCSQDKAERAFLFAQSQNGPVAEESAAAPVIRCEYCGHTYLIPPEFVLTPASS